jgi:ribose transport system permease protein
VPAVVLLVAAVLAAVFLGRTVPGRHLLALGRNEEAARYCGVATGRLTVLAYVACALLSGLGGLLFLLDVNSAQASSFGNFYELYAIAGAVLGGCALRGGEVSVLGLVAGAAVLQVLQNAVRLQSDSDRLEFVVVGGVILAGAAADELVRRLLRRRG